MNIDSGRNRLATGRPLHHSAMVDPYLSLVEIRKRPSKENISAVGRLLSKIKWEAASQQLEQKVRFGWRFPTDSNRIKNEHRLERRLLKEVRTVALPRMRGGLQTITFLAAAFPVGSGKRGQIDLLGISNAGGVCVVELKHGSNDPWWAVIEAAEYLLRLRTNYDRITKWMKDQRMSRV